MKICNYKIGKVLVCGKCGYTAIHIITVSGHCYSCCKCKSRTSYYPTEQEARTAWLEKEMTDGERYE